MEAATYHRIRAAVAAAQKTGAVTTLSGSTELSLPAAADYARNYMAMEGIHNVGVSVGVGTIEVGPADAPTTVPGQERRRGIDRRSGADRRTSKQKSSA